MLKEYQRVLSDLILSDPQVSDHKYGLPPKIAIVKFHDKYNTKKIGIGNIISTWRISSEKIELIEDNKVEAQNNPKSGMYFNEGSFYFSFSKDMKKVLFAWQVGPRYGRAFRYGVISDVDKVRIEEEDILWVS